MLGTCKLCLTLGVELQDSHYLPKAVYRQLRDQGVANGHPWTITDDKSFQTSAQLRAHLLCSACEERLNVNGENWVLRHFLKADDQFLLADILARYDPITRMDDRNATKVYLGGQIPDIDVKALAYFAASVFWRGSLHGWDGGPIPVPLGPYGEQFRRFLLGEQEFPKEAALLVTIREGGDVSRLTHAPVSERHGMASLLRFTIPGLAFAMMISRRLPPKVREYCFVHRDGNPLSSTPLIEQLLQDVVVKKMQGHRHHLRARDDLAKGMRRKTRA
jgi:hypothetical protein